MIHKLLQTIPSQNYFIYKGKYYRHHKEAAMCSPISSIRAEIFLQYYQHLLIKHWIEKNTLSCYIRYVDSILIIFQTKEISEEIILRKIK
jgi:hypothetical protein